jgi:hypothetical protein
MPDPAGSVWVTLGGSVSPTPVAQYRVTADKSGTTISPLNQRRPALLFQRYDGKGSAKPHQILLPPELVVRASCP